MSKEEQIPNAEETGALKPTRPHVEKISFFRKALIGDPSEIITYSEDVAGQTLESKNTPPVTPEQVEIYNQIAGKPEGTPVTVPVQTEAKKNETVEENEPQAETVEEKPKKKGLGGLFHRNQKDENDDGEKGLAVQAKRTAAKTENQISKLPKNQQAELDRIDEAILKPLAKGPSSFTDQMVAQMLENLPKNSKFGLLELVFTPRVAFQVLGAIEDEKRARAEIRTSVADTALNIAKLAKEDTQVKVFNVFLEGLDRAYGSSIAAFCAEHGMTPPAEGTSARQTVLLEMHAAQLGMEEYQDSLTEQWKTFVQMKAKMQGETAIANEKANMIPALLAARAKANPLEMALSIQHTAHVANKVGGNIGAAPVGLLSGTIVGIVTSVVTGYDSMMKYFENRKFGGPPVVITSSPESESPED